MVLRSRDNGHNQRNNTDPRQEHRGFRIFGAIGNFSVRFRWLVVLVWIIGVVLCVHFLPSLSSVTQSNNANFLPASAPSEKASKLAAVFGNNNIEPIPVVIARNNGQLTANDQHTITQIEVALAGTGDVTRVEDRGHSPDGQADELVVLAKPQISNTADQLISALRVAIRKVALPDGLQVHLAGDVATMVDNSKSSNNSNSQIELFSALFIIVLLVLIFRAPLAPIITLIPPLIVVTASGPLIAEASKAGLKVSSIAQLLLTVRIIGAGTDYGLFLIFRTKEELRGGLEGREAVVKALSRVGESITFSAATVIAALLSLLLATFEIYSDLGVPLAIGIGLMLIAGTTLLPALVAIFGRAVFWPSNIQAGTNKSGLWGRVSARVVQHPWPTLLTGLVVFGGLALAIGGYKSGGFAGNVTAPAGSDSAAGNALLAKHFPQTSANPTALLYVLSSPVWQNPAPLLTASQVLAHESDFIKVTGPLNPNGYKLSESELLGLYERLGPPSSNLPVTPSSGLHIPITLYEAYRSISNYVSSNGKTIEFITGLKVGDPGGTAALQAVPSIRAQAAQVAKAIGAKDYGVAGEAPALFDISNISNSDLMRVIPVAIIVIGLLLALLMRSLVAPMYLIASVALSYLAALGLVTLIFLDIGGGSGIVFLLPFLMFIFLLALGEDYNILVMTRIREEAHGLPLKQAVAKALTTTGTTVTSAGLVLAGTFAILAIIGGKAGGSEIVDIGWGLALGILMDTFLVRTLLVPSVVVLLDRWNWWPSKHGSWLRENDIPSSPRNER